MSILQVDEYRECYNQSAWGANYWLFLIEQLQSIVMWQYYQMVDINNSCHQLWKTDALLIIESLIEPQSLSSFTHCCSKFRGECIVFRIGVTAIRLFILIHYGEDIHGLSRCKYHLRRENVTAASESWGLIIYKYATVSEKRGNFAQFFFVFELPCLWRLQWILNPKNILFGCGVILDYIIWFLYIFSM